MTLHFTEMNLILERFIELQAQSVTSHRNIEIASNGSHIIFRQRRRLLQRQQNFFYLDAETRKIITLIRRQTQTPETVIDIDDKSVIFVQDQYSVEQIVDIDNTYRFYVWRTVEGDDHYAAAYHVNLQDETTIIFKQMSAAPAAEMMARVLGVVCDKPVWLRDERGSIMPISLKGSL
ncbi:MAG: hypothetical protein JO316_10735 [Abitibacteriaceae bacterium]|nr:hypothetical protein [Abditibacteriaceae bacterium]